MKIKTIKVLYTGVCIIRHEDDSEKYCILSDSKIEEYRKDNIEILKEDL